ncbi:MAG: hypothetical protein KGI75_02900 [Rhizobiaceae bacterium]|nr:hypothetical protein [Rhizobiaceae bacterium]
MTQALEVSRGRGLRAKSSSRWSQLGPVSLIYGVAVIAALLFFHRNAIDYVGLDNDDAMRLVEVRDFLGGQGWFDMMQYRLGLDGGTLMHWSRFIDLPIATLIAFFRLFLAPESAEAAALAIWPLALVLPLLFFMGLAGRRIAGIEGMHFALGLTALLILTSRRFSPGSIDHDNAQLCLVALATAMLADESYRPRNFAVAAVACAIALGIGAETTPFVAVACMTVAGLWAWEGEAFAPAARAFALTLTITVSAAFFALVPPHLYSTVTCDNLSLGFYGITSVGGIGLLVSASLASRLSLSRRLAVLAANGVVVFAAAVVLAPRCLRNPLADLDPLLVKLWLNAITEAQSVFSIARHKPETIGAFYATGFFAIVVCVFRIVRGERAQLHAVLLALLGINWIIALVQVRGAEFSNLLAIPPLVLLLAELRRNSTADSEDMGAAFFYVVATVLSVPAAWAVGGALANDGLNGLQGGMNSVAVVDDNKAAACSSREALAPIAGLEPGFISASSNMGSPILRFTPHRTLSGPYHRDQAGMLAELHIGLATPKDAKDLLRAAGVTLVAFCPDDPEVKELADLKPDGLYAQLSLGRVPLYLDPIPTTDKSSVQFFRFVPNG